MVIRWTEKALIETFIGALKDEIAEEIWMFKPKTRIELVQMCDAKLSKQILIKNRREKGLFQL